MSGETTDVTMKVESAPVTFSFDGAARNADALGLQGALELDVPSIRELAAWTGNPLDLPGEGLGPFNVAGQLEMTGAKVALTAARSEEHTSELQSLMRHAYAVFCLKQQNQKENKISK